MTHPFNAQSCRHVVFVVAVLALGWLPVARGDSWVLDSLDGNGVLSFADLTNATSYRVEWAPEASGPWTNFAAASAALDDIAPGTGGLVQVVVPRFFRAVAHVTSPFTGSFVHLEAEAYSSMSGVQLEPGGQAIGYLDATDWLMYEGVDFGTGMQSVVFKVAKESGAGSLELRLGSLGGTLIGVLVPQLTGGWALYQEQEIGIEWTSGVHDVYLVGIGGTGVCNVDWFRFSTNVLYEPDYALVWEDDFAGTSLDTTKWFPVQHGFVDNNEQQFYTDRAENISVSNGYLWLTARRETYVGTGPWMNGQNKTSEYTSGKVESLGKAEFQYGRIEASMKLPRGEGTWPAFWMLGANLFDAGVGWPRCGEIDIMEHPNVQDSFTAAVHTEVYNHMIGTAKVMGYSLSTYDTLFHVYGVEWTPDALAFYVDDHRFFTVTKAALGDSVAEWPFDQPFWLILNMAVGGPYGGDPSTGNYPYQMQVDWVRVYQDQGP